MRAEASDNRTVEMHMHKAWTPAGPQALTSYEVASILTDVLGRPIRYGTSGAIRYLRHATKQPDLPLAMALVTTAINTGARFGKPDGLTDDVRTVTGRGPDRVCGLGRREQVRLDRR